MNIYFITNWRVRKSLRLLCRLFLLVLAGLLLFGVSSPLKSLLRRLPGAVASYSYSLPTSFWQGILEAGLPTLVLEAGRQPLPPQPGLVPSAVQVLNPDLVRFLTTEEEYYPLPEGQESPPPPPPADVAPVEEGGRHPLVAIYNTHNAEAYAPSDGTERTPGKNASISLVAAALAQALTEEYGVPVVRSDTIHDYPDFAQAYANSEKTVRRLLAEYPSIQIVLDLHRDAGLKEPPVAYINDQQVAQILIVVGSDARLEHPNWRQNEAFARRLAAKMDELYPGLSRGVRVQEGRYNQHLHPRALLLEIGSSNNTLDQAEKAARLMARVLAEVLRDLQRENPLTQ
ncbi:MAG: stage II sporulation protein P [Thermoanaerobacteraceae bacterium]|nr:stage II sporulation protein P [Thermoanaerobacteraceae bacterium]